MLVARRRAGQRARLVIDVEMPLRRAVDAVGPVQSGVEPLRRVGRRDLERQHRAHLVVVGSRVLLRGEVAALPAPVGPGAREAVEHLAGRGLAAKPLRLGERRQRRLVGHRAPQERGHALLPHPLQPRGHAGLAEVLLGDDVGGHLRPPLGHLHRVEAEDHRAVGVADLARRGREGKVGVGVPSREGVAALDLHLGLLACLGQRLAPPPPGRPGGIARRVAALRPALIDGTDPSQRGDHDSVPTRYRLEGPRRTPNRVCSLKMDLASAQRAHSRPESSTARPAGLWKPVQVDGDGAGRRAWKLRQGVSSAPHPPRRRGGRRSARPRRGGAVRTTYGTDAPETWAGASWPDGILGQGWDDPVRLGPGDDDPPGGPAGYVSADSAGGDRPAGGPGRDLFRDGANRRRDRPGAGTPDRSGAGFIPWRLLRGGGALRSSPLSGALAGSRGGPPRRAGERRPSFPSRTPRLRTGGRWSGRRDSNPRPPVPKTGALPSCATPRTGAVHSAARPPWEGRAWRGAARPAPAWHGAARPAPASRLSRPPRRARPRPRRSGGGGSRCRVRCRRRRRGHR